MITMYIYIYKPKKICLPLYVRCYLSEHLEPLEGHCFSSLTLREQSSISMGNQQHSEEELSCVVTFFQLEMNHFNNGMGK